MSFFWDLKIVLSFPSEGPLHTWNFEIPANIQLTISVNENYSINLSMIINLLSVSLKKNGIFRISRKNEGKLICFREKSKKLQVFSSFWNWRITNEFVSSKSERNIFSINLFTFLVLGMKISQTLESYRVSKSIWRNQTNSWRIFGDGPKSGLRIKNSNISLFFVDLKKLLWI